MVRLRPTSVTMMQLQQSEGTPLQLSPKVRKYLRCTHQHQVPILTDMNRAVVWDRVVVSSNDTDLRSAGSGPGQNIANGNGQDQNTPPSQPRDAQSVSNPNAEASTNVRTTGEEQHVLTTPSRSNVTDNSSLSQSQGSPSLHLIDSGVMDQALQDVLASNQGSDVYQHGSGTSGHQTHQHDFPSGTSNAQHDQHATLTSAWASITHKPRDTITVSDTTTDVISTLDHSPWRRAEFEELDRIETKKSHGQALKRIVRCLMETSDMGIEFFPDLDKGLDCWVDASFARLYGYEDEQDIESIKSHTCFILTLLGCPVLWKSSQQDVLTLSSTASDYVAFSDAMRELLPMRRLLLEISSKLDLPIMAKTLVRSTVFEDNQACFSLVNVPKMSPRNKYLALSYHFFRSEIGEDKGIVAKWCSTTEQLGDIRTKGFGPQQFKALRKKLMGW